MKEDDFLLLDYMGVRNAVLFVVLVLALDGALVLVQWTIAVKPDLQALIGAFCAAFINIKVSVRGTNGLRLGVGRAMVFAVEAAALPLTCVEVTGLAVKEPARISPEEVHSTLVALDEAIGVAGAGVAILMLKAILVEHLWILRLAILGGDSPFQDSKLLENGLQ